MARVVSWRRTRFEAGETAASPRGDVSPDRPAPERRGRSAGQSLVEMALILPTITLILMGVIDLGRVFYTYEALANAAREGARYCALHPGDTSGTKSQIAGELDTLVVADTSSTQCPDTAKGNPVTVSIQATFTPITPLIRTITGESMTITASSTMVVW